MSMVPAPVAGVRYQSTDRSVVLVTVAVNCVVEQVRTLAGVGVTVTVTGAPPDEQAVAIAMTAAPTNGRR
jgi:hypothetical protein